MPDAPTDEAVVQSNGWFVIRNTEDDEQWIATDEPADVQR